MSQKTFKEVIDKLRAYVIDNKIPAIEIAYEADVSLATVYNFLKGSSGNNTVADYLIEKYGEEIGL